MNYGYIKIASAIPEVRVADCQFNVERIIALSLQAAAHNAGIVTFPETSITAYTCGDLFAQSLLLEEAEASLQHIIRQTSHLDMVIILGMPIRISGTVANTAVVLHQGKILGVVPKTYLPNYKEFYEKRWFTPADRYTEKEIELCGQQTAFGTQLLFECREVVFGIEICEDLWAPIPPSSYHTVAGADIIFNLSADDESTGKYDYLLSLISQQSSRCLCGYIFSSCGFGESSTDVVFAGNAFIFENGQQLACSRRFSFEEQLIFADIDIERIRNERIVNTTFSSSRTRADIGSYRRIQYSYSQPQPYELQRSYDPHPFVPSGPRLNERCKEIFSIQTNGLAQRIRHTNAQTAVIGISGGLDSTLALLVCVKTFDRMKKPRKDIVGVTMPGFGTTDRTYNNATNLMKQLGITLREISIREACLQHFSDIGHDMSVHDVTYENSQARERTQILMDIANQSGGMVIGTGDLSELALGWATYNGDHMSMYGVNAGIPKTLVKHLVEWVARNEMDAETCNTLLDITDTPISPELIPAAPDGTIKQKTEDLVGPYELHDFFLYYFMRFGFSPRKIYMLAIHTFGNSYDKDTIRKWLQTFVRRFFGQQFKRSCLPDGPKVGSIAISPRGDWRMPSDATSALWLKQIEQL